MSGFDNLTECVDAFFNAFSDNPMPSDELGFSSHTREMLQRGDAVSASMAPAEVAHGLVALKARAVSLGIQGSDVHGHKGHSESWVTAINNKLRVSVEAAASSASAFSPHTASSFAGACAFTDATCELLIGMNASYVEPAPTHPFVLVRKEDGSMQLVQLRLSSGSATAAPNFGNPSNCIFMHNGANIWRALVGEQHVPYNRDTSPLHKVLSQDAAAVEDVTDMLAGAPWRHGSIPGFSAAEVKMLTTGDGLPINLETRQLMLQRFTVVEGDFPTHALYRRSVHQRFASSNRGREQSKFHLTFGSTKIRDKCRPDHPGRVTVSQLRIWHPELRRAS